MLKEFIESSNSKVELMTIAKESGMFKGLLNALRGSDLEVVKNLMLNTLVNNLPINSKHKRRKDSPIAGNVKQAEKLSKVNTNQAEATKQSKMKLRIKNTSGSKLVKNVETVKTEVTKPVAKMAAKNEVKMKSKTVEFDAMEVTKQVINAKNLNDLLQVAFDHPKFRTVDYTMELPLIKAAMAEVIFNPGREVEMEVVKMAANEVEAPVKKKRAPKKTSVKGKKSKAAVMLEYILGLDGEWFSIDEVTDHVDEVCGEGATPTANKGGAGSFITSKLPARGYEIVKEEFEEGVFYAVESTPES